MFLSVNLLESETSQKNFFLNYWYPLSNCVPMGIPRKLSNPSNKSSGFLCKNGANCAEKKTRTNQDCPLAAAAAVVAATACLPHCRPPRRAALPQPWRRTLGCRCVATTVVVTTTEADIWKALLLESFLLLSNFFFRRSQHCQDQELWRQRRRRRWWRRADRTVHSGLFGFVIVQQI